MESAEGRMTAIHDMTFAALRIGSEIHRGHESVKLVHLSVRSVSPFLCARVQHLHVRVRTKRAGVATARHDRVIFLPSCRESPSDEGLAPSTQGSLNLAFVFALATAFNIWNAISQVPPTRPKHASKQISKIARHHITTDPNSFSLLRWTKLTAVGSFPSFLSPLYRPYPLARSVHLPT